MLRWRLGRRIDRSAKALIRRTQSVRVADLPIRIGDDVPGDAVIQEFVAQLVFFMTENDLDNYFRKFAV